MSSVRRMSPANPVDLAERGGREQLRGRGIVGRESGDVVSGVEQCTTQPLADKPTGTR